MPEAFLSWPLHDQAELLTGWDYRLAEVEIHGNPDHRALDVRVKWGTPVYAPFAGFYGATYQETGDGLVLSYNQAIKINPDEKAIKPPDRVDPDTPLAMTFGAGLLVQGMDEAGRLVQLAHLSGIEDSMPFWKPIEDADGDLHPSPMLRASQRKFRRQGRLYAVGELIGWTGATGCHWGAGRCWDRAMWLHGRPIFSMDECSSWTDPHLHIGAYFPRAPITRYAHPLCTFGIYSELGAYPTLGQRMVRQPNARHDSLWRS